MNTEEKTDATSWKQKIDWLVTLVPFGIIVALSILFLLRPEQSAAALNAVREFLGNELGMYYILLGIGGVLCTAYLAFSKYGKIRLGDSEQPEYSSFQWGALIFTSTMAADILFYSCCEWALYATDPHVQEMGTMQDWAPVFPLFHWGPAAWSFYIVLAVAFAFMRYVRKKKKQKFSEACRPLLGNRMDGFWGKMIDLFALFALLAGTATTFSLVTPLLSEAAAKVFHIRTAPALSVVILIVIALVYTVTVLRGMSGIAKLAGWCVYLFLALLAYVLFAGGETRYILETGIQSIGTLVQNFIGMSTYIDPLRENLFPQNWTIFYWAYWLAWCVATPFFIARISKGRTIRSMVIGIYGWGLAGTFTSFIILGNYGLAQQLKHGVDTVGWIEEGGAYATAILRIFETLPLPSLALLLLLITMIAFYSTTFDALTMVVASYSYKELPDGQEPDKRIRVFWAILFILFPIALIFAGSSLNQLQTVSMIAAFPIGIILLIIVAGFFRDAGKYVEEKNKAGKDKDN